MSNPNGGDAERRDLGVQRLHPSLEAELRGGVGGAELEADKAALDEMEMMCPERCLRMTGSTARVTFIGPTRLVASCRLDLASAPRSSRH
jgi:hypothetical protein